MAAFASSCLEPSGGGCCGGGDCCCRCACASSPSPRDLEEFERLTDVHRRLVVKLGAAVYPELDLAGHDASKYSEPERGAYAAKFVQKRPDEENPGWAEALLHHYEHNAHHPQHWAARGGRMPEPYLRESVVDMVAAYVQYQLLADDYAALDYAWFAAIDEQYLARYSAGDRDRVRAELRRLAALGGGGRQSELPAATASPRCSRRP